MHQRILFVDDEPAILALYQAMARPLLTEWQVDTAESGEKALARLQEGPYEVVVSDLRMPGMNGLMLLNEVRRQHPGTIRILLSGCLEQHTIFQCVGATHQVLSKPCSIQNLRATLTRLGEISRQVTNPQLQNILCSLRQLPTLPAIYFRIIEELDSPDASVQRLGADIAQDIATTPKLLQLVNSAFFGASRPISDPAEAVQLLGVATVRTLVLFSHVCSILKPDSTSPICFERLWQHSLDTGRRARQWLVEAKADPSMLDDAYTAGLLHDVGKLILAVGQPAAYREVVTSARAKHLPLFQVEREFFGVSHGEIGAYLLGIWGLPTAVVDAVAWHEFPEEAPTQRLSPLTAVHVANVLDHEEQFEAPEGVVPEISRTYLKNLGLEQNGVAWCQFPPGSETA